MQMRSRLLAPCSVRYRLIRCYTIPLPLQPRTALCLIERYEKDNAPETEQARRENQTAGRNAATAFFLASTASYPLYGKGEVGKYKLGKIKQRGLNNHRLCRSRLRCLFPVYYDKA